MGLRIALLCVDFLEFAVAVRGVAFLHVLLFCICLCFLLTLLVTLLIMICLWVALTGCYTVCYVFGCVSYPF